MPVSADYSQLTGQFPDNISSSTSGCSAAGISSSVTFCSMAVEAFARRTGRSCRQRRFDGWPMLFEAGDRALRRVGNATSEKVTIEAFVRCSGCCSEPSFVVQLVVQHQYLRQQ